MKRYPRPRRASAPLSESSNRQLNMYAVAAGATGVGLLALAQPAESKIVYTPAHQQILSNHTISLDLNHDGIPDFRFRDIYRSGTSGGGGWLSAVPAKNANQIWGHEGSNFQPYASALLPGVRVGKRGRFAPGIKLMAFDPPDGSSSCRGGWADVTKRYLGLKFLIQGKMHYGWARLNVTCSLSGFKVTALLTGYAYETVPDRSIVTGGRSDQPQISSLRQSTTVVPDSRAAGVSSLGLLARGSEGLPAWRKRKYAIAGNADRAGVGIL